MKITFIVTENFFYRFLPLKSMRQLTGWSARLPPGHHFLQLPHRP